MRRPPFAFAFFKKAACLSHFFPLAALLSLLNARAAWAGTYKVTYSGGKVTWRSDIYGPGPSGSGSHDYENGGAGQGWSENCSWGVKDNENGVRAAYSGEVRAEGKVTAHFVWEPSYPGELPPKSAVVYERTETTYTDGGPGHGGSGDCNTPLDHPVDSPIYAFTGPYTVIIFGHKKTSHRYTIKKDPGEAFEYTCEPTAHAEGTGVVGPPEVNGGGMASALYSAEATPATVGLDGTTE